MRNTDLICSKRQRFDHFPNSNSSVLPRKKHRHVVNNTVSIDIQPLGLPLVSTSDSSSSKSIHLEPYKPYTIGRSRQDCDSVFDDRRVSKKHCQILFDALNRKICLADGVVWYGCSGCSRVRGSLNGVFVNGVRIGQGEVAELVAGDDVTFVCGNDGVCVSGVRIGFVLRRIVFREEISTFGEISRSSGYTIAGSQRVGVAGRVKLLLSQCRHLLHSNDPIWCIQKCRRLHRVDDLLSVVRRNVVEFPVGGVRELGGGAPGEPPSGNGSHDERIVEIINSNTVQLNPIICHKDNMVVFEVTPSSRCYNVNGNHLQEVEYIEAPIGNGVANGKPRISTSDTMATENTQFHWGSRRENRSASIPPPGNKFYLNRLQSIGHHLGGQAFVSLPELLYPVDSLLRIFVATFTSDILWFLSCCEIPAHLPVTIACHNRERCWSSSPDQRTSLPFSDFPNLAVVYPPFPEVVAFGKDRRKSGIACHHPKLLVLQREDSIRVVISSANLGPKQWNNVTNTVWWQDFPRTSGHDILSLFTQLPDGDINQGTNSDFAAQLAGFMASLVADVPSQAHWILELTKYDFKGSVGHLVASVPGVHSLRAPSILKPMYFLPQARQCASRSQGVKVLGSVETSVVGLSHLFHTSADSNGAQLKKLASFLGKCRENANGMLEIVLRRNRNIPADANAVSILVPNPEELSEGDCVQLGFVPRNVAQWVAPLSDIGLFRFSGCVYPKEVLATALDGSTGKVQMILYVSQGPAYSDMSQTVQSEHVSAICSLVAAIQRSSGIWRLQEVLSRYKWPEHLETDFVFCASSIGSVNPQFLAAFSAAAGKTSVQFPESEESDPDWGCWSASQELKKPSIRIIFPTIERVKNASCGILASKYLLCFSQKTWQRLRIIDILHDAIPYPNERVNHPMHVKVARRRFQCKKDSSSFGWVYCGSHNLSAAAWGRPIYKSLELNTAGSLKTNSVLGSRLHVCNYELGIIFIVPPPDSTDTSKHKSANLDDIVMPFVVPAPKYKHSDTPATAQAMREALAEREREMLIQLAANGELVEEEIPDDEEEEEEEVVQGTDYITEEKEDEKAYAEKLWSQVDSSESC